MKRVWTHRAGPVAVLLLVACAEPPTGPPTADAGVSPVDLAFHFPAFVRGPVVVEAESDSGPVGPARVVEPDEEPPPPPGPDEPVDPSDLPASDVWDQRTRAGFQTGSAWAWGFHAYQGNKGAVTTTVNVALDGVQIGSQSARRQDDAVFWFDFAVPKRIDVLARAYVAQECGLSAWGRSEHSAWWEAIPGANIATFGLVIRPSSSDLEMQAECPPEEPPVLPGPGGGGGGGGYCFIEVWYYEDTGEVISSQVLYCEETGG